MTPEEGAAEIPSFLAAADQASIDGFNTWCVSKLARREGLKVVLSGLGGDEWFAGYRTFEKVPQFHLGHQMLGPLRPLFAKLLSRRPSGSPWRRVEAFLRGGGSWLEAFHVLRGIFTEEEATELTQEILGRFPKPISWGLDWMPKDPRACVSELEVSRYMRNQLLRDADVFSMAHGLELRVPLVDIRLADALLAIPSSDRLLKGKRLLVDAVPEIPDWIRNQPKRGFAFPFQEWMEGPFGEHLAKAHEVSPIPLNTWYRTWAVAKALSALELRQP
jgi:asparagine synthase (glutamine-hydrolysing)